MLTLLVAAGVIAALVAPAAVAAGGPVPPICPPSPVPSVPSLTTCPTPAPSPSPAPAPAPAASSAQETESAKVAKTFALASTPDLARSLLVAVNATRRAHGLRALRLSAPLTEAAY